MKERNRKEEAEVILSLLGEFLNTVWEAPKQSDIDAKENPNVNPDLDRWFDLTEFCNYHPVKPAKPTVYGWVSSGLVPVHKRGKKLYFLQSEIDQWLREGRRKTRAERERSASSLMANKKGGAR